LEGNIITSNPGLSIKGVYKTFEPTKGPVLQNINLDVPANSFFALLGPSGCGKSTLLRIIAGLETLDSGSIYLNGVDITRYPANLRKVNTVFQNFALFPHLTVRDNIAFGLKAQGIFEAKKDLFLQTIESLELDGLEYRYPDQLSGGQQQRVALARALVNEPQVLLLDEPMSHLDEYLKSKVSQDLLRLQRKNKTIFLMVTHDREEAMSICNYMAILNKGQIVQKDEPNTLYFSPRSVFVAEFMGKANIYEGSLVDKSVTLPFYSDGEAVSSENLGKVLINPEFISVRKQKRVKKANAISRLKKRKASLSIPLEAPADAPIEETLGERVLSYGMVSNGEILSGPSVETFTETLSPQSNYYARAPYSPIKFRGKPKKSQNTIELNAVIDEVRYRGYALELSCKINNTVEGHSLIQVITNTKDPNWKKGDNLVLSIKKKDLKTLEPDTLEDALI
jgi:ABC-type Fe3+/spermidine/putrescine transport system ATPase subunit